MGTLRTLQELRRRLNEARRERQQLSAANIKLRWQLSITVAKFAAICRPKK